MKQSVLPCQKEREDENADKKERKKNRKTNDNGNSVLERKIKLYKMKMDK